MVQEPEYKLEEAEITPVGTVDNRVQTSLHLKCKSTQCAG